MEEGLLRDRLRQEPVEKELDGPLELPQVEDHVHLEHDEPPVAPLAPEPPEPVPVLAPPTVPRQDTTERRRPGPV